MSAGADLQRDLAPGGRLTAEEIARRRRGTELPKPRPKGVLSHLPEPELLPTWLTAAFRPPRGFEFETFERSSVRKDTPCSLTFRNGRERRTFRFDRQLELQGGSLRAAVVGISAGWLDVPHLTGGEIEDVWVGLCKVARVLSEYDDRDETTKWMHQLLDESVALRGHALSADGRHNALMALRAQGEFVRRDAEQLVKGADGWQRRPSRLVDDETGFQYVRSGETATFVRWVIGERQMAFPTLRARLAEIGVEWGRWEDRRPPHPKLNLYQLTEDLVEYIEAADPTPAAAKPPAQTSLLNGAGDASRVAS